MPVTILDAIVLIFILISATLAMVRGFVRELLSVAAWVAAAAAAYYFYRPVVPFVTPFIQTEPVPSIIAAAIVFVVALLVASYITMRIADFVIDSRIGAFDRILGFVFGVARGVLILAVVLAFFTGLIGPEKTPPWVRDAATKPFLDGIGNSLIAALPEDAEATILKYLRGGGDDLPGSDTPSGTEGGTAPDDPSYNPGTRQGLDQLIDNTNPGQ